jgi:hypothetical protein
MFYGELEEPHLCETTSVDVAAASTGRSSQSIATEFTLPSEVHLLKDWGFRSDFEFSVTFEPQSGVHDFNFIESAAGRIEGENGACGFGEVASLERNNTASAEGTLLIPSTAPVDLVPCLDSGKLNVLTTFAGNLPTTAWKMDVKVCLSGKARLELNSR